MDDRVNHGRVFDAVEQENGNSKTKHPAFFDNASSHPNLKLSNIELVFLPPNTTSETQPLDQGIKRLICKMETATNVSDLIKDITVLDAIFWLKESVDNLTATVVPNCFRKAGFQLQQLENADDFDSEDNIPLAELRALMEQCGCDDLSAEEFVQHDNIVLTKSDTQFKSLSNENTDEVEVVEESDDDDDNENAEQTDASCMSTINYATALDMLKDLRLFAYAKENNCLVDKIEECVNVVQEDLISNKTKQASITDFFPKQ